jgi:Flp pilus assembly protein TadG
MRLSAISFFVVESQMFNKLKWTKRFSRNEKGNVAVMFALSLIPMVGSAGVAIDYGQASHVKTYLQAEVDSAALNGAKASAQTIIKKLNNDKAAEAAPAVNSSQSVANARYLNSSIKDVAFTGRWLNGTDFEVTATAKMDKGLSKILTPSSADMNISARAVARVVEQRNLVAFRPAVASLDFEAGDYNRMYVYCFNRSRKNDPDKGRRAETMTAISDNGGTTYAYSMPQCDAETETLSYRLYNVRMARTNPGLWDAGSAERFNHYSDTRLTHAGDGDIGVAKYNFSRGDYTNLSGVKSDFSLGPQDGIMETKLCDTLAECKPKSQGGILPEGRNRKPNEESKACAPGKFMYYGMEDRPAYKNGPPPGIDGWTDRDYDDIRLVVECPRIPPEPTATLKLIQ